jgi:transposase
MEKDLISMSQRDRDVLKVMSGVLKGDRTQVEAARLLNRSVRQIRRLSRRMKSQGDGVVVHGLRGRPSNHRVDEAVRQAALRLYREKYADFGPTLAAEKLAEEDDVVVAVRTLGDWLLAAGLWRRKRERDRHRSRRARRACFGELVQADACTHDWLEGRGVPMALVGMIDDATSRVVARFHPAETTAAYMDVLGRWIGRFGRFLDWYSDRHGIFRAEDALDNPVLTEFSRALKELDIGLICANSPQAKGRVERLWGTAQDRLVKELRLAKCTTLEQANEVLETRFLPWFNRRCVVRATSPNDAHRALGSKLNLAAILSHQAARVVANDYTIRFGNEVYQLLAPAWPGERGGRVIVERRLDGSMQVRFKDRYLPYRKVERKNLKEGDGGDLSLTPEPIPAGGKGAPAKSPAKKPAGKQRGRADESTRPAVHRPAGCSGRTPAEPCPSGGGRCGSSKTAYRPAPNHPWRTGR